MTSQYHKAGRVVLLGVMTLTIVACGPRVIISTGTTIGLKATPGDGSTRSPQVTFAYKRTEFALVPTGEKKATSSSDAFSTLASINFYTQWFGETKIRSLLSTGVAARDIQGDFADKTGGNTRTPKISGNPESGNSLFWQSFKEKLE